MTKLKYGNTNTFFVRGDVGGLLFDTDWAGTLPAFYASIKQGGVSLRDIIYVMASHFHPDHMGLIGDLINQGVGLLLMDLQVDFVHYSDRIFARDALSYAPIDEKRAIVISCEESRGFLSRLGIMGEIISTPSHSADSVSLILDDGDCLVGDMEPFEYIEAYGDNSQLKIDWERVLSHAPKRIFYAHIPEKTLKRGQLV